MDEEKVENRIGVGPNRIKKDPSGLNNMEQSRLDTVRLNPARLGSDRPDSAQPGPAGSV